MKHSTFVPRQRTPIFTLACNATSDRTWSWRTKHRNYVRTIPLRPRPNMRENKEQCAERALGRRRVAEVSAVKCAHKLRVRCTTSLRGALIDVNPHEARTTHTRDSKHAQNQQLLVSQTPTFPGKKNPATSQFMDMFGWGGRNELGSRSIRDDKDETNWIRLPPRRLCESLCEGRRPSGLPMRCGR